MLPGSPNAIPVIEREFQNLKLLQQENIISVNCIDLSHVPWYSMELVHCSVQQLIDNFGRLHESTIRYFTTQALKALEYLHVENIVHGDIKPGNMLVTTSGILKISDFGSAKSYTDTTWDPSKTLEYKSPGDVLGQDTGAFSDIWALAISVIQMATGVLPWVKTHRFLLELEIMGTEIPPLPQRMSPKGRDFIAQCCDPNTSATKLLQHPFITQPPPDLTTEDEGILQGWESFRAYREWCLASKKNKC
eukprot:PhF_6_TR24774/c0_g1_i1/m.34020